MHCCGSEMPQSQWKDLTFVWQGRTVLHVETDQSFSYESWLFGMVLYTCFGRLFVFESWFSECVCIIHVLDLLLNHDLFLEAMAPTLGLARDEPAVGLASLSWRQLWIFSNTWPQNPKTCGVIFWTYSFQKSWCKSSHIEQSFQKQFNSIYIYISMPSNIWKSKETNVYRCQSIGFLDMIYIHMFICLNLFSVHVISGVASQPCVWECLVRLTLQVLLSLVSLDGCAQQDHLRLRDHFQVRHPMMIPLPPRRICLSPPDATPLGLEDDAEWVFLESEEVDC